MIARREVVADGKTSEPAIYLYPFNTLPLLNSHLHPKFAIFDAGTKMAKLIYQRSEFLDNHPGLIKIWRLYNAWKQSPPKFALGDESYQSSNVLVREVGNSGDDDEGGDDLEEDSDYDGGHNKRNKNGRENGFFRRPRTRSVASAHPRTRSVAAAERDGNGGDQIKSGRRGKRNTEKEKRAPEKRAPKRKVLSETSNRNQHLLSEATLSRLDHQIGEAAWTGDRIHQWSKTFPKRKRKL